jgi:RimJ/RimL family protein N-acetyltransferase
MTLDPNFHITTPRLYLTYLLADIDGNMPFSLSVVNTPKLLKANEGVRGAVTEADARARFNQELGWQVQTGYGRYMVSLKDDSADYDEAHFAERIQKGTKIGIITCHLRTNFDPEAPKVPDLGFGFLPEYEGKGYATEACQGLISYFEKEKGQKELFGFTSPTNLESLRLFARLGLQNRGLGEVKGIVSSVLISRGPFLKKVHWNISIILVRIQVT